MKTLFAEDIKIDHKLIGKTYTIKNLEKDGSNVKGKLINITADGSYEFQITTPSSEYESFITKIPNCGDVE